MRKTIIQQIQKLEKIAENNLCDGDCDLCKPFIKCDACEATHVLNEIGEMLDNEDLLK